MNLSTCVSGKQVVVTKILMTEETKRRLLYLGLYEGACIQLIKHGGKKRPSLLLICGNLCMIRAFDLAHMEGEYVE